AEDGIRDKLVTGVQTCALPIYLDAPLAVLPELLAVPELGIVPKEAVEAGSPAFGTAPVGSGPFAFAGQAGNVVRLVRATNGTARSEERRVGKECRCRGSA